MAEIGKRIRSKREELGLTQEELAARLGYKSKTTIAKIENGTNDIVQSKVVDFAKALNTSVAYLMGWSESSYPNKSDYSIVLDSDERLLIERYKTLSEDSRKRLLAYATALEQVYELEEPVKDMLPNAYSKLNKQDLDALRNGTAASSTDADNKMA